jgi:dipeptidyl-peptidase-4
MKKIILSVLISTSVFAQKQVKEISMESLWKTYDFAGSYFSAPTSMNNGEHFTQLQYNDNYGEIVKYEYKTFKELGVILKGAELVPTAPNRKAVPITIEGYLFSPDEKQLLIWNGTEQIYRHSTRESYYIIDIATKKITELSASGKQSYARFSPDGSKVSFVRENNLFFKDLISGTETQISFDGKNNSIINGAVDWVYEEEFTMAIGYEWSADGSRLAYYRFDETAVKEFNFQTYGELYPNDNKYKYPKAGEDNSDVTLMVYDVKAKKSINVLNVKGVSEYIPRFKWTTNSNVLSVQRMNRLQNKLELMLADFTKTGADMVNTIYTETSDTYIEINDDLYFLENGKQFIWCSEKEGWMHYYLMDMNGKQVNQITKGEWEVTELYGVDEKKGLIYFQAAAINATEREVYSIKLDGSNMKMLSTKKGQSSADFSAGYKYYILSQSDANTPTMVTLHTADGKKIKVLDDNKELVEKLGGYALGKKEFMQIKTEGDVMLNAWMIKPANFDANKKYPVFFTIYGGPGNNTVDNTWEGINYMWHQLLAQKGYIVVSVDNRGTGQRGKKFKHCTYGQLGKNEVIDQIEAAKYFGNLPYVDKNRIGVFGWSYGGYMSSLCITKGADYFKMAIAVAPVTTWRYYDSIYTERYMGLPQANSSGYDDNSPINHVSKLKGKYLLIHGTADDNVHFQNAVDMVTALVKANKKFDSFYYPNKNHGIGGGNTRLHLYNMMTDYIIANL